MNRFHDAVLRDICSREGYSIVTETSNTLIVGGLEIRSREMNIFCDKLKGMSYREIQKKHKTSGKKIRKIVKAFLLEYPSIKKAWPN